MTLDELRQELHDTQDQIEELMCDKTATTDYAERKKLLRDWTVNDARATE